MTNKPYKPSLLPILLISLVITALFGYVLFGPTPISEITVGHIILMAPIFTLVCGIFYTGTALIKSLIDKGENQ